MPEYSPSGRFQVLSDTAAPPHKCNVCGWANPGSSGDGAELRRRFVTWNFDAEYYGIIYICDVCAHEIGQTMNMVPDVLASVAETVDYREQIVELAENLSRTVYQWGASTGLHIPGEAVIGIVTSESLRDAEFEATETGPDNSGAVELAADEGPVHVFSDESEHAGSI